MQNDFEQMVGTIPGMEFIDPFAGNETSPQEFKDNATKLRAAGIQHLLIGAVMILTAAALMGTSINIETHTKKKGFWR